MSDNYLLEKVYYLLDAFEKFKHPYKKLHIVGPKIIDYKFYLKRLKIWKILYTMDLLIKINY